MSIIATVADGDKKRVLTRLNGLQRVVSCSCCDENCCMYPADAINVIGETNLPAELVLQGQTLSKNHDEPSYGSTSFGVFLEDEEWARYINGVRGTQACLFQGVVDDTFLDQYLLRAVFDGEIIDETILTRNSRCWWNSGDVPFFGDAGVYFANGFVQTESSSLVNNEFFPQNNKWLVYNFAQSPGETYQKFSGSPVGIYTATSIFYFEILAP